ncbi:hypothetical protein [Micromonospora zamorensis]
MARYDAAGVGDHGVAPLWAAGGRVHVMVARLIDHDDPETGAVVRGVV